MKLGWKKGSSMDVHPYPPALKPWSKSLGLGVGGGGGRSALRGFRPCPSLVGFPPPSSLYCGGCGARADGKKLGGRGEREGGGAGRGGA